MKKQILAIASWSIALLVINVPGTALADPDPSNVGGACARQLGMNMDMSDPDSRTAFQECRRSLQQQGVVSTAPAPAALTPATCPMNPYDILVDNTADLRVAVADPANAGATIAIQGLLNVNDDGLANVEVFAPGITLTCASDGAGLTGAPSGALLEVLADDVTVEWLNFSSAFTPAGNNFGIRAWANNDVVRHNMLQCRPFDEPTFAVCVLFIQGSGGLAEHNTVTGSNIGIVAFLGDTATIRNNSVSECATCVLIQDHAGGTAEGNEVQNGLLGVWMLFADEPVARNNRVTDSESGIVASTTTGNVVIDSNHVERCVFNCLESGFYDFSDPPSDSVSITNNTVLDCSAPDAQFASCVNLFRNQQVIVADNYLQQSLNSFGNIGEAVSIRFGLTAEIRNNRLVAGSMSIFNFSDQVSVIGNDFEDCGDNFTCVTAVGDGNALISGNALTKTGMEANGIGIEVAMGGDIEIRDNRIDGMFERGLAAVNFSNPASQVSILRNNIEIAGGPFAEGISHFGSGLLGGRIEQNRIKLLDVPQDAFASTGIVMRGDAFKFQEFDPDGNLVSEFESFALLRNYRVANNVISGARVGILADATCSSAFVGNALAGNQTGAVFGLAGTSTDVLPDGTTFINELGGTGANVFAGNHNSVEESNLFTQDTLGDGYLDCKGDGSSDPNLYSGAGRVQRGNFGQLLGAITAAARSRQGDPAP
jgi:nitrous oxidase accessory protein NosD